MSQFSTPAQPYEVSGPRHRYNLQRGISTPNQINAFSARVPVGRRGALYAMPSINTADAADEGPVEPSPSRSPATAAPTPAAAPANPNAVTYQNPTVARESANTKADEADYLEGLAPIKTPATPVKRLAGANISIQMAKAVWDHVQENGAGSEGFDPVGQFAQHMRRFGLNPEVSKSMANNFIKMAADPATQYQYMTPKERMVSQGPLDPSNLEKGPLASGNVMHGYDPIDPEAAPTTKPAPTTQPSADGADAAEAPVNPEDVKLNAQRQAKIKGLRRRSAQMLDDLDGPPAPVDPKLAVAEVAGAAKVAAAGVTGKANEDVAGTKAGATTQAASTRAGATTQAAQTRADATTQAAQTTGQFRLDAAKVRSTVLARGGRGAVMPNASEMFTFGQMIAQKHNLRDKKGNLLPPSPEMFADEWLKFRGGIEPSASQPSGATPSAGASPAGQYKVGQSVPGPDGKIHQVVGFDTDGHPLVTP